VGVGYVWRHGVCSLVIMVYPSSTTTYTVTVTAANGFLNSKTATVTVVPNPTALITPPSATICSSATQTLTASGGTTYSWIAPVAATNTITVNPTTSTVYTVDVTNACSTTQTTFSVTVNQPPVINATNTGAYCVKDSIHLSETLTTGFTYSWTGPNSFSSALQNPFIPNATAANAGTYSLTVIDNNSCQSSATTAVVVNTLPVLNTATPPVVNTPATCGLTDGSVVGSTASGASPFTYQWISSSGVVLVNNNSDLTGVAGGIYYLAATDNNGCRDSVSFTVLTSGGPAVPTFAAVPAVCEGSTFTLTVNNPIVGATYNWVSSGNPTQSGVDLTSITVASASSGNVGPYTVEVVSGGCSSFGSISATLNATPIPAITGTDHFCFGTNTVLASSSFFLLIVKTY